MTTSWTLSCIQLRQPLFAIIQPLCYHTSRTLQLVSVYEKASDNGTFLLILTLQAALPILPVYPPYPPHVVVVHGHNELSEFDPEVLWQALGLAEVKQGHLRGKSHASFMMRASCRSRVIRIDLPNHVRSLPRPILALAASSLSSQCA